MQHARVRVALVTGANRGIGFEVCRQLAAAGFVVLLTVREATKAQAVAEALSSVGRVEPLLQDVADADSIAKAAAEVASQYNCLDVLINNAGIHYDTWEKVEDADIEGTVTEAIRTNLLGPWRTSKAFLPLLGRSRAGRIVNGVIRSRLAGEDGWGSACVPSDEGGPECPDTHPRRRAS